MKQKHYLLGSNAYSVSLFFRIIIQAVNCKKSLTKVSALVRKK